MVVRLWFAVMAWCLALAPVSAFAEPDEDQRRQAIEIGQSAIELYERGQYRVALERFRTADRAQHSPAFALYEARCLTKLGRLTEALRTYERLNAEALPPDAPAAWRAALSDASVELGALQPRVPSVRVAISGGAPAALMLDGAAIDVASAGSELFLDPGKHEIEARDAQGRTASARFELAEGERNKSVPVVFATESPAPAMVPVAPPSALPSATAVGETEPPAGASRPATDALGVGLLSTAGVGLVVGTVTGLLAASKLRDIRQHCVQNHCRASDRDEGNTVDTLALVSTIGFAAGGACLGAWGVRVVLTSSAERRRAFSSLPGVRITGSF